MPSKEKELKKQQKKAEKKLKAEAKQRQKQQSKPEVRHVVGQLPPGLQQVQLRNPRPNSLPVAPVVRPGSLNSQRSMESSRSLESQLRTPNGSERTGGSIPPYGYPGNGAGPSPLPGQQHFSGYLHPAMNHPGFNGQPLRTSQGMNGQFPSWQYQQGVNGQPPLQYQQGVNGQPPLQYQQGVNGQPPLQYQQGVNGQPPLQYQQGVSGQPPLQYQQGVNGKPPLQYQQGVNGQPPTPPLPYQQGVKPQPPLPYQQGVNAQPPLQYQQGVKPQPPLPYQQGVKPQPPLPYQQGANGQPPQQYPQKSNEQPPQQSQNYGHVVNGGQRDSYFLPEADYDQGGLKYMQDRFRPQSSSGNNAGQEPRNSGYGAASNGPADKNQEAQRPSSSYNPGRQYGSQNSTINRVFNTQLNSELRHKIEEKRQEIPEEDDWQFGKGKDPINPDLKTHQTMIHAKQVANILNQEMFQRKPLDQQQQVAYRDPNVY